MRFYTFIFLLLIAFIFSKQAHGHALGSSFEKVVGKYFVDIGYEPDTFVADQTSTFSFDFLENESRDFVEYKDIWVRIAHDRETIFATGVSAPLGTATMLYSFPKAGSYSLNVRYQGNDGEALAETSFPITVADEDNSFITPTMITIFIIGLISGGIITLAVLKITTLFGKRKKEINNR